MGKLHCFVLAVLLVGAVKSEGSMRVYFEWNGLKLNIFLFIFFLIQDAPVFDETFFDQLPELGPHVDLRSLNPKQAPLKSNGGRLLTPEEGCGKPKVFNSRIVGGTAATHGNNLLAAFNFIFVLNKIWLQFWTGI